MRAAQLLRAARPRAIDPRRARVLLAASSSADATSASAAMRTSSSSSSANAHKFGPIDIPDSQVFCETPLSLGLVNLKPVVPGHVLIISRRVVARFADLTPEETTDLWSLAKRVGTSIEPHFGATSLTYAIQDGPAAGQTVPHVHVHVLPRKPGDFENNDEVYERIEESGEAVGERERAFMGKEVIREQPAQRARGSIWTRNGWCARRTRWRERRGSSARCSTRRGEREKRRDTRIDNQTRSII